MSSIPVARFRGPALADGIAGAVLLAGTVAVFGIGANLLGFYSDDAGFLTSLPGQNVLQTLQSAAAYVPGRNLHIIWQQALFVLFGSSPADLGTQHLAQAVIDGLTVLALYVLTRQLGLSMLWGLIAAYLFAFYPNHGETHFWLSSAPMNLLSTLFAIAYAITVIYNLKNQRNYGRKARWVSNFAEYAFFAAALFTYDQTFFVLLLVLAVRLIATFMTSTSRLMSLMARVVVYGCLIVFYVALKLDPSSGPTLTHVTLSHILETAQLSVSLTVGPIFLATVNTLNNAATTNDRSGGIAIGVSLAVMACLAVVFGRQHRSLAQANSRSQAFGLRGLVATILQSELPVIVLGGLAAVCAYMPTYLWYISPRHNFLPTVGLALMVGATGALLTRLLGAFLGPRVSQVFGVLAAGGIAIVVANFVTADLSEKSFWIDSYQLRLGLYRSLVENSELNGKTAVVFENFPANLGPAQFFGQENQLAINYLYPNQSRLTLSAPSSLGTDEGYFLDTELDRYGMAVRFLPKSEVLNLNYIGVGPQGLQAAVGGAGQRADSFFTVTRQPPANQPSGTTSKPIETIDVEHAGESGPSRVSLDVEPALVPARSGDELVLVLSAAENTQEVPLHTTSSLGERIIVPIDLMSGTDVGGAQEGARFQIDVGLSNGGPVNKAALYLVSDQPPVLLDEAVVSTVSPSAIAQTAAPGAGGK